jgi:hypothetical protein
MIIYNVTINVDDSVHDEWLHWMKTEHIPDVMNTGLFTEKRMLKVLDDHGSGGTTYSVQYSCNSMDDYEQYKTHHAPGLQAKTAAKYKDKFVAFRTLLEIVVI